MVTAAWWGPRDKGKQTEEALLDFDLEGSSLGLSGPCGGFSVLAVVLSREIFQGSKAVAAGHVLLELLLERLETHTVLLVGTELGDVKAGGVGHVDHVGVGQHGERVLLRADGEQSEDRPRPR